MSYDQLQALTARITEVTQLLEEKEMRWLELSE
jgi:ATP-binding cassette subfamily F protein uup